MSGGAFSRDCRRRVLVPASARGRARALAREQVPVRRGPARGRALVRASVRALAPVLARASVRALAPVSALSLASAPVPAQLQARRWVLGLLREPRWLMLPPLVRPRRLPVRHWLRARRWHWARRLLPVPAEVFQPVSPRVREQAAVPRPAVSGAYYPLSRNNRRHQLRLHRARPNR
jgi:hypothetical protein